MKHMLCVSACLVLSVNLIAFKQFVKCACLSPQTSHHFTAMHFYHLRTAAAAASDNYFAARYLQFMQLHANGIRGSGTYVPKSTIDRSKEEEKGGGNAGFSLQCSSSQCCVNASNLGLSFLSLFVVVWAIQMNTHLNGNLLRGNCFIFAQHYYLHYVYYYFLSLAASWRSLPIATAATEARCVLSNLASTVI